MIFKDPLATLQYMGGAPPIHLMMALYSFSTYILEVLDLQCDDD